MSDNFIHEEENRGCSLLVAFPVISFWSWIVMLFVDIRVCLGGLVGLIVSAIIFFNIKFIRDIFKRFCFALIVACAIATCINFWMGVTTFKAILLPIVMLSGIVIAYVLYYNFKNEK